MIRWCHVHDFLRIILSLELYYYELNIFQVNPALIDAYMFRLPRAYVYADYIWPGLLMSPERLKSVRDIEFRPTDILICSYPKSGWLFDN